MRSNMNLMVIVLALVLLLTACRRHDEPRPLAGESTNKPPPAALENTNQQRLVSVQSQVDPRLQGTWTWDEKDSEGTERSGSMIFAPDGSYESRSTNRGVK